MKMHIPTKPIETPKPSLEFITGPAGSGKTYTLRKRMEEYKDKKKKYATLTATTGIAAINLSGGSGETVTTINSELGYFDTASLIDAYKSKRLHRQLKAISKKSKNLSIDEISMMDKVQLDVIRQAQIEVNEDQSVFNRGGLGLVLSGDFCQLPPVKGEFCFNAKCWPDVQITKLEKVWRQSDPTYLTMLNAARCGDGTLAAQLIKGMGITLTTTTDTDFEGTTIVPVNSYVDALNDIRLKALLARGERKFEFKSYRWGKQLGEWKNIPDIRTVCRSAYIMILANDAPKFTYANGSCGRVVDAKIDKGMVVVKLVDDSIVEVRRVTRKYFSKDMPEGYTDATPEWLDAEEWHKNIKGGKLTSDAMEEEEATENEEAQPDEVLRGIQEGLDAEEKEDDEGGYKLYLTQLTNQSRMKYGPNKPYFDFQEAKWVLGEITYTPIRLAYASTVHKSQGLSLDRVQIDYTHKFFGEPSMSYVALSRCRTPEGLVIVGNPRLIEERTNISAEILPWI